MRFLLTLTMGACFVAACSTSDLAVTPEPDAVITIESIDTYTGIAATRKALEAVRREFDSPVALASGAQASGLSVADRRAYLESLVQGLRGELEMYERDASFAAMCTVHRDAEYQTRFTTAGIGYRWASVSGYTSTTRSTQIRNSVYAEIVRGVGGIEYGRGTTAEANVACGYSAFAEVRMTYSIGRHDHGQMFTMHGETAHIIPGRMTWTRDRDVYYVPVETRELRPDTTDES